MRWMLIVVRGILPTAFVKAVGVVAGWAPLRALLLLIDAVFVLAQGLNACARWHL